MKKSRLSVRFCALALLFACVCASFFACSAPRVSPREAVFYDYFDTVITVSGYDEDFDETAAKIEEILRKYHTLCDIYSDGTLKSVNETAGEAPVAVPEELFELLVYAKDAYERTNGKCSVAFGAVTSVWHSYREQALANEYAVPTESELKLASEHTDINDLILDADAKTVYFADPELSLDLGAFAKGYVADIIANELCALGKTSYALSVGGTVITTGAKSFGESWVIGVENPADTSEPYVARVALSGDRALATSGSYQRYYEHGGERYHHIIDTETLYPENEFLSVTVAADSAADADAFSTAIFCMPLSEGKTFAEENALGVLWVLPDGSVVTTDGFPNME